MGDVLSAHYPLDRTIPPGDEPERYTYQRTNLSSIPSEATLREIARQERLAIKLQQWRHWKQHESASIIQRMVQRYFKKLKQIRLELEHRSATRIQVAWRWRHCDAVHRGRVRAAKKIQSFERMRTARLYYLYFHRETLILHRHCRILATSVQRLWRGYGGKANARKIREQNTLPDPANALHHEEWVQFQKDSNPPRRTWCSYSEYVLGGYPRTWPERTATKRHGMFFRDVKFWINNVTRTAYWDQPDAWKLLDRRSMEERISILKLGYTMEQYNATRKVQQLWRAKVAKRHLQLILTAHRLMSGAEERYFRKPKDLSALCNYVLYVHVRLQDYRLAKGLYQKCMENMMDRGGDNAFILYSYAIFCARINSDDSYLHLWRRGRAAEERYRKRCKGMNAVDTIDIDVDMNRDAYASDSEPPTKSISAYKLANAYFRQNAIVHNESSCWDNYALCRWIAFEDIDGAQTAFMTALRLVPNDDQGYRRNRILHNLNTMLELMRPQQPKVTKWDVYINMGTTNSRQN